MLFHNNKHPLYKTGETKVAYNHTLNKKNFKWKYDKGVPDNFINLFEKMVRADPFRRISAEQALYHEFFEGCEELIPKNLIEQ